MTGTHITQLREILTSGVIAILELIIPEKTINKLTYEDTISYFVTKRPKNPKIAKGSLLIDTHRKGYMTIWTFLDDNNDLVCDEQDIPYGRKLLVKSLDDELLEAFNQTKLLIFE